MSDGEPDKENVAPGTDMIVRYALAMASESSRGCVLLAASLLDVRLETLLRVALTADAVGAAKARDDLLDGAMAPLRSTWAKSRLALTMGLVTPEHYGFLERLRNLRNSAAHELEAFHLTRVLLDSVVPATLQGQVQTVKMTGVDPESETGLRALLAGAAARVAGALMGKQQRLEKGRTSSGK
jgi:hypothetical protein